MAEKRDRFVHFVMTQSEYARMQEKMKELGIKSQSAYIRKMLLDGYCINLDLNEVRELVIQLRRCGNNLNQYTKKAHQTGNIYERDIRDLQGKIDELWVMAKEILSKLSKIQ